jgi:hypothetical protein
MIGLLRLQTMPSSTTGEERNHPNEDIKNGAHAKPVASLGYRVMTF